MNHPSIRERFDLAVRALMPESIAARAHELWVSCGEPVVQDDAVWQEAERELVRERKQLRTPAGRGRLAT